MITGDFQLEFKDYATGKMITLGGADNYCSVRFDGIGSAELRAAERELTGEDGVVFGPEYLGTRKWTINGAVKVGSTLVPSVDPGSAWDSMTALMRAWDYYTERKQSRAVIPLYFKRPGRETTLVYGRPERIDPDVTQSHKGFITYQASFRQSDLRFYSYTEYITSLTVVQPAVGGLKTNATQTAILTPFVTSTPIIRQGVVTQSGDVDAPVIMRIFGPVVNPVMTLRNLDGSVRWRLKVLGTVATNKLLTIDTRMWRRSALTNDNVSFAGALSGPRLSELVVPPGTYEFAYEGTSTNGSSRCEFRFRDTWGAP